MPDLEQKLSDSVSVPVEPEAGFHGCLALGVTARLRRRRRVALFAVATIVVAVVIYTVSQSQPVPAEARPTAEHEADAPPVGPAGNPREMTADQEEEVKLLVDSARERIGVLRSGGATLAVRIRKELRHAGDRAVAARMVAEQAANRQAIDLIRVDLWFDLRNILSDEQLEALDEDLDLRILEAPLQTSRTSGSSTWSGAASTGVPVRLTRSDITRGIRKIRSQVSACGPLHKFTGKVSVKIKIGSSGRVSSATAHGGTTQMRSCVSRVMRHARFRRTKHGMSVKYPFVFR